MIVMTEAEKAEAYRAVQRLFDALSALNNAGNVLAVQAPTTPYSRVSKAAKAVLVEVAKSSGLPDYRAKDWAELVYQSGYLDGAGVYDAVVRVVGYPATYNAERDAELAEARVAEEV